MLGIIKAKQERQEKRLQKRELPFDGVTCPVREHTADGAYVGRCDFAVYGGYCPRHGLLSDYLKEDGSGDDRDFPQYGLRTWPEDLVQRRQLGVREQAVKLARFCQMEPPSPE